MTGAGNDDACNPESWNGPERRVSGPLTLRELEEHIDRRVSARLDAHAAEERRDREALMSEIKQVQKMIMTAFPDGDAEGHRRFHEESIETMRDLRDLMRRVRNNTVTGIVWAAIVLCAAALWSYIKGNLGGG